MSTTAGQFHAATALQRDSATQTTLLPIHSECICAPFAGIKRPQGTLPMRDTVLTGLHHRQGRELLHFDQPRRRFFREAS
ncbi:MAG: hypothetical protein GY807_12615 [Gammaproteobacteria bacterium]|nr:hypothetical protein [Gammaproteobacteria bacterium]